MILIACNHCNNFVTVTSRARLQLFYGWWAAVAGALPGGPAPARASAKPLQRGVDCTASRIRIRTTFGIANREKPVLKERW